MLGTVHIVDDDDSARNAISRLLSLSGYRVCVYDAGQKLLDDPLDSVEPACILLDLRMLGLSGLDVLEELSTREHPPVIMVSAHGDVSACATAMKAGALDFLEKPVGAAQLQRAIDKALAEHAAAQASTRENSVYRKLIEALTRREQEVLRYVISGRQNKVIASELKISEKTVKVHRARVIKKMQVRSVAELARICTLVDLKPAAQQDPQQVERRA
jgi:FixJ family two-component response regulator